MEVNNFFKETWIQGFGYEVRYHFEGCVHFDSLVPILKLNNHCLGYNSKFCQKPWKPNIACSHMHCSSYTPSAPVSMVNYIRKI